MCLAHVAVGKLLTTHIQRFNSHAREFELHAWPGDATEGGLCHIYIAVCAIQIVTHIAAPRHWGWQYGGLLPPTVIGMPLHVRYPIHPRVNCTTMMQRFMRVCACKFTSTGRLLSSRVSESHAGRSPSLTLTSAFWPSRCAWRGRSFTRHDLAQVCQSCC